MHTAVRRFIKTGIGFLFAGVLLGVYMIVRRELWGLWPDRYLISAHAHAVQLGFVMFLILGVALWLFPRAPKDDDRYDPSRIALAFWLLALGTAARVGGEVLHSWMSAGWLSWTIILGGVAQALGLAVYFFSMWPRIRPVGSHLREAKGERF